MVNIKGYEFKQMIVRDSYNRRALQCKNNIINYLTKLGLSEDDIEIPLESNCMKKAQASIAWYMWDQHLFFSYTNSSKFVENLFLVESVIKHFINLLITEQIDQEEFINYFKEDFDIAKKRKEAREVLGVDEDSIDFEKIHQNYKKLAKEHHPDMSSGDTEMFKKINVAHKILKKELN